MMISCMKTLRKGGCQNSYCILKQRWTNVITLTGVNQTFEVKHGFMANDAKIIQITCNASGAAILGCRCCWQGRMVHNISIGR